MRRTYTKRPTPTCVTDFKDLLAKHLTKRIRKEWRTQTEAAFVLGLTISECSLILNGKLESITIERLLGVAHKLQMVVTLSTDETGVGLKVE
jgi:predicted XRE-type DNA-binding protein